MKRILTAKILAIVLTTNLCCSKNETPINTDETDSTNQDIVLAEGCPDTEYDDWQTSDYVLPFPVGETYFVNLSHCSGSYHSIGEPDQFAIDFGMQIGSIVSASREGTVVVTQESGEDGGFPNNLVVIKHEDDTFAQYMHLTKDGALVEIGDEISQGQKIGLSGSTGLAGYPHLHFVLTDRMSYPYKSIPTTFRNTVANERSLAAWTNYTALPF